MSRPKQIVHRDHLIQFKVTPLEHKAIQLNAMKLNMNVSQLCRDSLFNVRIYKPFSEEELDVYKSMIRFKTDFDRIARYFKNKDAKFTGEVLRTSRLLNEELNKFKI